MMLVTNISGKDKAFFPEKWQRYACHFHFKAFISNGHERKPNETSWILLLCSFVMFIVVFCCHSLQNVCLVMHIWRHYAQVSITLLLAVTSLRTTVLFINLRQPVLVVWCRI
jgi:hypothetical protein